MNVQRGAKRLAFAAMRTLLHSAKAGVVAVYRHMARFIRVIDELTEAQFCDELIQRFEASPHRVPGRVGAGIDLGKKNSTDLPISVYPEWQSALREVFTLVRPHLVEYARQFSSLVLGALSPDVIDPMTGQRMTLSVDNLESAGKGLLGPLMQRCYRMDAVNLQKYERNSGNFRHWHSEIYPEKGTQRALHRVLFWILYLNDVSVGGETEFLYQGTKVFARRGRLLIAPAGFTHTHRGNVPASNDKYILTSWLLFRSADELYG